MLAFVPTASATGDGLAECVTWAMTTYSGNDCFSTLGSPAALLYSDSMTDYWTDEVATWSFDTNLRVTTETAVEGEDMGDADFIGWGTDTQTTDGIDTFDLAYVVSHGGDRSCSTSGLSFFGLADSDATPLSQTCVPDVQQDTEWGDTALNQFFTAACSSVQECVWDDDGYDTMNSDDFQLYGGYHGINTDGPFIGSEINDYVNGARSVDVGSDWISIFTEIRVLSDDDDCPGVIIFAQTSTQANNYFNDAGLDDYYSESTGDHSKRFWFFTDGCDPDEGTSLSGSPRVH